MTIENGIVLSGAAILSPMKTIVIGMTMEFFETYSRGVAELTLLEEAFFFAPLEAILYIICPPLVQNFPKSTRNFYRMVATKGYRVHNACAYRQETVRCKQKQKHVLNCQKKKTLTLHSLLQHHNFHMNKKETLSQNVGKYFSLKPAICTIQYTNID